MAIARRTLVDPAQSGVFHCISRCVRRAFLCGRDSYSGRNFEHRRAWIRDRLRELTEVFALEVHAYAVMSNHLHVVARTLPERIEAWSDEEVARRWLRIFPGVRALSVRDGPPDELALRVLCRDRKKLALIRTRLADLSWFMRCLNEPIARRANREDNCSGRFWEGRFKCEKLDDEGAALACMAYVDLNPVRAGMAATPEQSDFTSAQDRATARKARHQLDRAPQDPNPEQAALIENARKEARSDQWLAPIGALSTPPTCDEVAPGPEAARANPPGPTSPLLHDVTLDQYLELLDWTGRQIRAGKRGRIAAELSPLLERLDLDVEAWVENVETFGGLFHRIAGKLRRLRELASATGRSWLHGQRGARQLYATTP
ncbi:MAG: transposase [bacterium]|nr:transposase [bacterium]